MHICVETHGVKVKSCQEKKENTQVKYRRLKNLLYYRLKVLVFVTSQCAAYY